MNKKKNLIKESIGNIFADLGLRDADELQAKSSLVHKIATIIKRRKLTQIQAAKILGIDQPKISNLLQGRLDGFSTERIFRFLICLNQDIEIIIKPKLHSRKNAKIIVLAA